MWNEPSETELGKIPKLYSTEELEQNEIQIVMHFFLAGSDWFIAEWDPLDRIFYGFVVLNNDLTMAEWGYISFDELKSISFKGLEIGRDYHWIPKKFKEVYAELEKKFR